MNKVLLLTNKGILYTDEQNEISMLDYNSIISFEVTRKFLSTKLMVVTSEGKIIELKKEFLPVIRWMMPLFI